MTIQAEIRRRPGLTHFILLCFPHGAPKRAILKNSIAVTKCSHRYPWWEWSSSILLSHIVFRSKKSSRWRHQCAENVMKLLRTTRESMQRESTLTVGNSIRALCIMTHMVTARSCDHGLLKKHFWLFLTIKLYSNKALLWKLCSHHSCTSSVNFEETSEHERYANNTLQNMSINAPNEIDH